MIETPANSELPAVFISHGAPNLALHESEVRSFMGDLASRYPRPKAIVICSAHFETSGPAVGTDANPEMIYDFRGFEPALYEMVYPAPGEPALAERVARLLEASDDERLQSVQRMANRGYDHGTWVPLIVIYPEADIPVVQISIDPDQDPEYHYALGAALAPLRKEGILLMASGQITHNLPAIFTFGRDPERDKQTDGQVSAFVSWFEEKLGTGDTGSLLNYRSTAPYAVENHPTDDHLLPIYFAMGAAGDAYEAKKLHASKMMGVMAMDAYEFRAL